MTGEPVVSWTASTAWSGAAVSITPPLPRPVESLKCCLALGVGANPLLGTAIQGLGFRMACKLLWTVA